MANSFNRPVRCDQKIIDGNRNAVGTVRIKPNRIAWKPGHQGATLFYSVDLDKFIAWITDPNTRADKVKS